MMPCSRAVTVFVAALLSVRALCCSTVIVGADASATGSPLLWKHRDSSVAFNYVDHFRGEKYSFTGIVNSTDSLKASVWCGTNSAGLSVMNSVAYGLSPLQLEDRPWEGIVMKKVLGTCATIAEFEEYVASLPQPNGLEANFGVADASGEAAYFEVHDYGYTRFDVPRDGYLVRTNWSVTGRPGEGKGYDRSELVESLMASHEGLFDASWILEKLARESIIARKTSLSSVVMDGNVLWCEAGYSRACYAIPVWVAAGDDIPSPLRHAEGLGCEMNELAERLKLATRGRKAESELDAVTLAAQKEEFLQGGSLQESFDVGGFDAGALSDFNRKVSERFEQFKEAISGIPSLRESL